MAVQEGARRVGRLGDVRLLVVEVDVPLGVEYALTTLVKILQEPLAAICAWVAANAPA